MNTLERSLFVALASVALLQAQGLSGSIAGTVRDPAGLAVAGAAISAVHVGTGAARPTATDERGDFFIGTLPPGDYTLRVTAQGFRPVERTGLALSASETLATGTIVLAVGSVTDSVTVQAEGAVVQTASSERAGTISGAQVENIQSKGRNIADLLSLLPGVVFTADNDLIQRNWQGININGGRVNSASVTLDGMGLNQLGASQNGLISVSQDAVAEVKVLLSNYQAEYGRYAGGDIQIVTKSGTRDFHGLVSFFKRHEQFNANNFFNNRLGVPLQRYRFNTWTYNVGGPVFIPGKFNNERNKLFFFWAQEYWPVTQPNATRQVALPTEAEREGDFSRTVDLNGALIPVVDPDSRVVLPGNRVPASRINPSGQSLMKFFPLPNYFDRQISAGRYNFVNTGSNTTPQLMESLKVDYYLKPRHLITGSMAKQSDKKSGYTGVGDSGNANFNQMYKTFSTTPLQVVVRYQAIFSPTMVNEFALGGNGRKENDIIPEGEITRNQRKTVGFTAGQFSPGNNPLGLVPNATFGGVTNPGIINLDGRTPLDSSRLAFTLSDGLTKTAGAHILKAGLLAERTYSTGSPAQVFAGAFDFGRNTNNPLDSGYAYSNALMGVFNTYTEVTARPNSTVWTTYVEWYAQDTWKATRRLTLDIGMRFYRNGQMTYRNDLVSAFFDSRFDRSKMVQLIRPATVGGRRAGVSPVNGAAFPAAAIGAIAPGSGDPYNGMAMAKTSPDLPRALIENPGLQYAPRLGFAWDPFGKGKTAVRGGAGIFFNRTDTNGAPNVGMPVVSNPTLYYGTIATFLSSAGLVFPQSAASWELNPHRSSSYNLSLSVQQNIGFGTVLDVGYVGTLGRHLLWSRDISAIPFGANFDPKNADPTNTRTPLASAFLRSRQGYEEISYSEWAGSSNYHSLQVQANRRLAAGVRFGASWSWSKAMDFADTDNARVASLVSPRVWNYGLAGFDRTHVFKLNYVWELPRLRSGFKPLTTAVNGWQLSGISSFVSGAPVAAGYSFVAATDITGTTSQGARVVVTGNPVLPKGERTFSRNFRTEVFAPPQVGPSGIRPRRCCAGREPTTGTSR